MSQALEEERTRRFKLALRAGIPVLILVFLVFFNTIYQGENIVFTIKDGVLLTAVTFITIYFIYFLMNLSVQESILDQTTQGFNQKTIIKKLEEAQPNTLAILVIDNLVPLNENYGIEEVDALLYTIHSSLHLIFRQQGFNDILIGRHRGGEFLIGIESQYEEVKNILEKMPTLYQQINQMEISYKYAVMHNNNFHPKRTIIQLQDLIASQAIDANQKNTAIIQDAQEFNEIEKCVSENIKKQKLLLSFKPLLNMQSNQIDSYEVSVTLPSWGKKNILPRVFLPIVNRLGLGREYDFNLIKHIVELLPLVDEELSFSFNLSPFSLRDKNFQDKLFTYLKTQKVNPSRLIIQLYERKTHHDLSGYLKTLKKFRSHGMRICIDNFGSSSASMEYMKHFRFDIVQFDRDYVTHLDDKTSYAMLHSLVQMSKDLEIQTIAKWVDTEEQKKRLKALEIDYIQGFGVSKILKEEELIEQCNQLRV